MSEGKTIRNLNQFTDDCLPVDTLNGNIVLIPREIASQLGLPDTNRFPHYGGDYEYIERAKRSGIHVFLFRPLKTIVNYTADDVIRYMPVWMQWHFAQDLNGKIRILKALRSLKFNHNIWHNVNRINIKKNHVFWWIYEIFYLKKIVQCLLSSFMSKPKVRRAIQAYCQDQGIHLLLAQSIQKRV